MEKKAFLLKGLNICNENIDLRQLMRIYFFWMLFYML